MKYQDAVEALEENRELFTFDNIRKFALDNHFGRDLFDNEGPAYDFDGERIEAYAYLTSGTENNQYRDFGHTRQFAALVRKVIAAA